MGCGEEKEGREWDEEWRYGRGGEEKGQKFTEMKGRVKDGREGETETGRERKFEDGGDEKVYRIMV